MQDRLNQYKMSDWLPLSLLLPNWAMVLPIAVEAAFDGQTGTIWLLDSVKHIEDLFYQNIANEF